MMLGGASAGPVGIGKAASAWGGVAAEAAGRLPRAQLVLTPSVAVGLSHGHQLPVPWNTVFPARDIHGK